MAGAMGLARRADDDGPKREHEGVRENTLYVGNLDPRVNEYQMIQLFKDCGKIVRTDYLWHRDGPRAGEPRGCGFIEFASREEAIAAKDAVNGKIVLNRPVRVRFVTEKVDFKRRRADESTIDDSREYLTPEEEEARRRRIRENAAAVKKQEESLESMQVRMGAIREKIEEMRAARERRRAKRLKQEGGGGTGDSAGASGGVGRGGAGAGAGSGHGGAGAAVAAVGGAGGSS